MNLLDSAGWAALESVYHAAVESYVDHIYQLAASNIGVLKSPQLPV